MRINYNYTVTSLTTEEWLEFLREEKDSDLEVLFNFYRTEGYALTHKEYIMKFGGSTGKLNGVVSNSMAKRINKKYGLTPMEDKEKIDITGLLL